MRLTMNVIRQAVALTLGAIVLVACDSTGGDEPAGLDATASTAVSTGTSTPTADSGSDAEAIAHLKELNDKYWAVFTNLQNEPRIAPEMYDGITTPVVAENNLAYIQRELVANGLHREGSPEISNVEITVDGDSARLDMCIDESKWNVFKGDEQLDFDLGVTAAALAADRSSGKWLISEILTSDDETESTC